MPTATTTTEDSHSKLAENHPHDFTMKHNFELSFSQEFFDISKTEALK